MEQLDTILTAAYEKKASDVHLVVDSPPVFRVDGTLIPQKQAPLTPRDTEEFAKTILTQDMWEVLGQKREIDFSYAISGIARFRVNAFYQRSALSLAFRIISKEIPSVDSLA